MAEPRTDHVVMDYPVPILAPPTTKKTVKGKPRRRPKTAS